MCPTLAGGLPGESAEGSAQQARVWDSIAVESIRCEVVSAEPRTSSGGSRGSASTAGVLVQTSNCGSISVSQGVTFQNKEKIASSFMKGSVFEFDIGVTGRRCPIEIDLLKARLPGGSFRGSGR